MVLLRWLRAAVVGGIGGTRSELLRASRSTPTSRSARVTADSQRGARSATLPDHSPSPTEGDLRSSEPDRVAGLDRFLCLPPTVSRGHRPADLVDTGLARLDPVRNYSAAGRRHTQQCVRRGDTPTPGLIEQVRGRDARALTPTRIASFTYGLARLLPDQRVARSWGGTAARGGLWSRRDRGRTRCRACRAGPGLKATSLFARSSDTYRDGCVAPDTNSGR